MPEQNERAFVERELAKSGFPLEIELSSFLEEKGWTVAPSTYYFDYDLGIWRDIDIVAGKTLSSDLHGNSLAPYQLRLTLFVHCKKSDKYHWVFYARPRRDEKFEFETGLLYTDLAYSVRQRSLFALMFPGTAIRHEWQYGPLTAVLPPTIARNLTDTHQMRIAHPRNLRCLMSGTKSHLYEEVPDKTKMPPNMKISEVVRSLLKATMFGVELSAREMNIIFERLSKRQALPTEVKWPIEIFLPIIVFDGRIWTWAKKADRTDQVLLQAGLTSPYYTPTPTLICVVNKDRFLRLIAEIEEDFSKIAALVTTNLRSLNDQRAIVEQSILGTPG